MRPAESPSKSRRACLLTPPGRGAVATIGVRGSGAIELVSQRFSPAAGKPLAAFPIGRVVFGRFRTTAETEEELVVGLVAAEEVEIHCHGGSAAATGILTALAAEGAELIEWSAWAQEVEADQITAEALVALASARTQRTAAILLDQYRGALQQELGRIAQWQARGEHDRAKAALRALAGRIEFGLHLARPWQIVIAGRPNVGKSTLINALLGYQRAIVFDQPGTTRDVLTAATAIDGWPVELADTAGLRAAGDALESEGVAAARRQIAAADLVLLVLATTEPFDPQFAAEIGTSAKRVLVVHNKCDLAPPPADGRPAGFAISAALGTGLDQLVGAMSRMLVPDPPPPGAAVPFSQLQAAAIDVSVALPDGREYRTSE